MEIPTGSKSFVRLNPHLFIQNPVATSQNPAVEMERQLHDLIEAHCRAQGWLYVHSRMDAPSTIAVGFPDFAIFMPGGVTVFLECKRAGGKATPKQLATLAHARKLGFRAEIVTSMGEVYAAIQSCNHS